MPKDSGQPGPIVVRKILPATRRGAFALFDESDLSRDELCRHRTEKQATICLRRPCFTRSARQRAEALARKRAGGT